MFREEGFVRCVRRLWGLFTSFLRFGVDFGLRMFRFFCLEVLFFFGRFVVCSLVVAS